MRVNLCFRDMFGEDCVSSKEGSILCVTVDGKTANLSLETRVWRVKHLWLFIHAVSSKMQEHRCGDLLSISDGISV